MTTRRRGVALTPIETRHDVIVRAAQLADELGYEAFAVPEGWGLDSTLLLTELALRTRRVTLVSAVLSVWGRSPATLAMTAAVEAVRAANPRPRPQEGTVPAEARVLLEEFTANGTPGQVREQLERWDGVADLTMVALPPGMPWDAVETTLRAAAP
jgi:alkanesulfonate monooxygenase SsuD/methylene tetrahydromethanopterin reductase-like flavin-dependent oxidoreductase (luciferase family)